MKAKELIDISEMTSGTISSDKVINLLRKTLKNFELSTTIEEKREVISKFYKDVEDWEIILAHPAEHKIWLQGPIRYFELNNEYSLSHRIKAFFKKGILLNKKETIRYADIVSNTKFPVELTLPPIHSFSAISAKENKFYYTAFSVLKNIEHVLDRIEDSLAVYKKPAGIVAMNGTIFNIKEMSKMTGSNMSSLTNSIETAPFSQLISDSEVGLITNIGFESYKDSIGENLDD